MKPLRQGSAAAASGSDLYNNILRNLETIFLLQLLGYKALTTTCFLLEVLNRLISHNSSSLHLFRCSKHRSDQQTKLLEPCKKTQTQIRLPETFSC